MTSSVVQTSSKVLMLSAASKQLGVLVFQVQDWQPE